MLPWLAKNLRNGPTREGWYYLIVCGFVIGGAIVRDINLLLLLAGLLLAPLLFNGYLAGRTLRRLRIGRQLPSTAVAGEPLTIQLTISGPPRNGNCWLTIHEDIQKISGSGQPREPRTVAAPIHVALVAGEGQATYTGSLPARGRYRWQGLQVSTSYPWGLARRSRHLPLAAEILVYPRLGRLSDEWSQQHRETWRAAHQSQPRQGHSGEFYGLRDWRPGDNRRLIHWRSTARHGSLLVRQFEQPRSADLILMLDLWQPRSASATQRANVESAISFAATVVQEACRQGDCRIVLGIAGRETAVVRGAASQRIFIETLDLLAVAAAHDLDQTLALESLVNERSASDAQVVIVTTRPARAGGSNSDSFAGDVRCLVVDSDEFRLLFAPVPATASEHV